MVPHTGDTWMPVYLSFDGGATWFGNPPFPNGFNTMVPGFPTDTSAAGLASPLLGLDGAGDPVIRFDRTGNLLVGGIAFNRNFDQGERPLDTVSFVARYRYTPGTPATASTTTSAGAPPHFTYQGTSIVDRGAVGFAVPGVVGFAGNFTDKPWMGVDLNSPSASPCSGDVYFADTNFHGAFGSSPVVFSRSTDGGVTWSSPRTISSGGPAGASHNQGADIAVAPNGTVYVAFEAFSQQGLDTINLVKSTDCGSHWTQPVIVNTINAPQAPGVAFRTPTFAFVATDDTNPNLVYVAYLVLREQAENREQEARFAAVLGIIGFLDVPIIYFSVKWWNTLHQGASVSLTSAPTMASISSACMCGRSPPATRISTCRSPTPLSCRTSSTWAPRSVRSCRTRSHAWSLPAASTRHRPWAASRARRPCR